MRMRCLVFLGLMAALVGPVMWAVDSAHADGNDCHFAVSNRGSCTSGAIADGSVSVQARDIAAWVAPTNRPVGREHPAPNPGAPTVRHPVMPRGRLAADVDSACTPGTGSCLDGRHAFLPPAKAPVKPADPAPAVPAAPAVSLEDVAGFVPRTASIRSQPNGWALVGAPVNLLTDAAPQVVDGTLLGRPAQVRFVPVAFTWDHGDGTSATVEGPGASWRDLRQHDFTATPTSHVYDSMGDRQIALTIAYAPSYRFDGGGWQQIAGTLPVQVGPVTIHVLEGSTVLVGGVCGSPDAGPGC
jgi:hypothetical protein